jgi:site-specific DNA recombinase
MKKNIGLIRVSSISQRDNTSLKNQRTKIQQYCNLQDIELHSIIEEVESGRTVKSRKGIEQLRTLVENGEVARVIVLKIDRLSRDLYQGISFIKYLTEDWNIELISITESINSTTLSGKLLTQLLLSFAEFDKNNIVARLHRGKERKYQSDGQRVCGNIPFGYEYDNDLLVLNDTHKRTIRFIFRRWLQLADLTKTKRMLTVLDELRRKKYLWRGNKSFNKHQVKYLLKNSFYCGWMNVKGFGKSEHQYDTVISKKIFARVQVSLA